MALDVAVKRVYEAAEQADGRRVLVDRLWPRGVSKDEARLDLWLKDIAPSDDLRKWFGHDPDRWEEFRKRYRAELEDKGDAVGELKGLLAKGMVTLLYGAHDETHNNAVALAAWLHEQKS
jgi:uncharacterized protein YeaO (DUF488 family)